MTSSKYEYCQLGGLEYDCYFSIQLGMSSSQLTKSYFSEGPKLNLTTNYQIFIISLMFCYIYCLYLFIIFPYIPLILIFPYIQPQLAINLLISRNLHNLWGPLQLQGIRVLTFDIITVHFLKWLLGVCPISRRAPNHTVGYSINVWQWVKTYDAIFGWMNIHLPSILMFTRCQGFDPLPYIYNIIIYTHTYMHIYIDMCDDNW